MFSVAILLAGALMCLNGSMPLADALMTAVISFLVFAQIESAGSGMAALRVVGSSIDHAQQIDSIPQMDERGRSISPESHSIEFDHVDFSYGDKRILHDVSLFIPDKTTTAIVGPSGSGKTTLCSLIARFWDVDAGCIRIGGQDVRAYTLEALMEQISMVFQNVYLFADTIENNIRFGRPQATHAEVEAAARAACCHEFITALPQGYNTMIGEGGATLSGGEKQRISICLLYTSPRAATLPLCRWACMRPQSACVWARPSALMTVCPLRARRRRWRCACGRPLPRCAHSLNFRSKAAKAVAYRKKVCYY